MWVLGVRKWMLSTMTQITTTMVTSTMPKSRNLWAQVQPGAPAQSEEWRGEAGRDGTHLPMRGMAMDVAGSLLEISSRKTDWARSTEMAIDVFSPPGEPILSCDLWPGARRAPRWSLHYCSQCHGALG